MLSDDVPIKVNRHRRPCGNEFKKRRTVLPLMKLLPNFSLIRTKFGTSERLNTKLQIFNTKFKDINQ